MMWITCRYHYYYTHNFVDATLSYLAGAIVLVRGTGAHETLTPYDRGLARAARVTCRPPFLEDDCHGTLSLCQVRL
jgi:hypothetical protein